MDDIDRAIIDHLQRYGRLTNLELADRIGLSPSPCLRRVRQLETGGVIQGYTAIVSPERLGLNVHAFIEVKLERHSDDVVEQFRREVAALEAVVSCHAITGEYDFMLQVVAADLALLSNVILKKLMKIAGVRDVHSSIVLDTIKRSMRVPLGHLD